MYDMLIRKKNLKIQERLGMRLGIAEGIHKIPVAKNVDDVLEILRELYKIGLKAFVIPKDVFSDIKTANDIYKVHYGNILKIRDMAQKFNIEVAIQYNSLTDQPDEKLKIFATIASLMDARIFYVNPSFYSKMMPPDQALKLAVYKINEITNELRVNSKIGLETSGKLNEVGSVEEVIDMVKRTQGTEAVINWGNIHGRGSGALRSQPDFRAVIEKLRNSLGSAWLSNAYFIFSGVSYGPSGKVRNVPLSQSDINLEHLIREIMSFNIKGTLILDDPEKDKFILKMLERLADMVR